MLAGILSTMLILYLAVGVGWFSVRRAGYSHVIHTISELGERGAPDEKYVAFRLFLPVGLLALWIALLIARTSPALAALAGCLGAGYVVAAFFPCDPGSPRSGSFRQGVHNLGGAVQYVGGGFALVAVAQQIAAFKPIGYAVLGCTIALSLLPAHSCRGIIQRFAELLLFGSLLAGVWLGSASA